MDDIKWDMFNSHFYTIIGMPTRQLTKYLQEKRGVRVGQSAVVSRYMHTFSPDTPQKVNILQDVDAGHAFYRRQDVGQVCHIDIFHQRGLVNHKQVAASIKTAVEAYNLHDSISRVIYRTCGKNMVMADYIDLQTGTGGGRITGSLTFGQKPSLRRAHENHVHVAMFLPDTHLAFLFYLILAVEKVILSCNLELRQNEKLVYIKNTGRGGKTDLSHYSDQTDSFLQERNTDAMPPDMKKHQMLQDAVTLSDHFDTIHDIKDVFDNVEGHMTRDQMLKNLDVNGNMEQALACLSSMGLIDMKSNHIEITQYGKEFKNYLDFRLPDIEAHLRQLLSTVIPAGCQPGQNKIMGASSSSNSGHYFLQTVAFEKRGGELSVIETVTAAARRMVVEKNRDFMIKGADLRQIIRQKRNRAEILLLIDASSSMVGQRILAAKFLVRHLVLTTPDKIGVVTFQENKATVNVPLTRDYRQIEQSLRQIKVAGATPLAFGLKTALNYLDTIKTTNPIIILLTDGVPTLAYMSRDPIADALAVAQDIKHCGYRFLCIGLKPHQNYLTQLAESAGGNIYLLDELEKQVLVKAAWVERNQRCI